MIKGFHPAKNGQILLPVPTESSEKSLASEKKGQSSWASLYAEERAGILEHGPRKRE